MYSNSVVVRLFAVAFVVAIASASAGLPPLVIRETDGPLLYLNFPIKPYYVNAFLGQSPLQADVWQDLAWVSLIVAQVPKLEVQLVNTFVPIPGKYCYVKAYVPVFHRMDNGSMVRGSLELSLDFDRSITGKMRQEGCAITQAGVLCLESRALHFEPALFTLDNSTVGSASLEGSDGAALNVDYRPLPNGSNVDPSFLWWIINRPYKFEIDHRRNGENITTMAVKTGLEDPDNFQAQGITPLYERPINSTIFSTRFPGLASAETQGRGLCMNGECFISPHLRFVDRGSKKMDNNSEE